jgi:hypothetical protein
MSAPSVVETKSGFVDINEYGNDDAWKNVSVPSVTGSPSSSTRESLSPNTLSPDLRAIATDYHDSMAVAA